MTSSTNYPKLIKECMLWAETIDGHDGFEAFIALAAIWIRIADFEHKNGFAKILPLLTNKNKVDPNSFHLAA